MANVIVVFAVERTKGDTGLMADKDILDQCRKHGVDGERLRKALDSRDNWGALVHSFEYLTVLGIVADAFAKED